MKTSLKFSCEDVKQDELQAKTFFVFADGCFTNSFEALSPDHLAEILLEYRAFLDVCDDVTDFASVAEACFSGHVVYVSESLILPISDISCFTRSLEPYDFHRWSLGDSLESLALQAALERSLVTEKVSRD